MAWRIRRGERGKRGHASSPTVPVPSQHAPTCRAGTDGRRWRRRPARRERDDRQTRHPAPAGARWLQTAAGWSWRLLLLGLLVYVAARLASALRIVVLPCVAALLLTALLQPLTTRLKRSGRRPSWRPGAPCSPRSR